MQSKTFNRIGRDYQEANPEKVVLFRIENPFSITEARMVGLSTDDLLPYLIRNRPARITFYDSNMFINIQSINGNDLPIPGKYTDYYFFNREYYDLAKGLLTEEKIFPGVCPPCPSPKRVTFTETF